MLETREIILWQPGSSSDVPLAVYVLYRLCTAKFSAPCCILNAMVRSWHNRNGFTPDFPVCNMLNYRKINKDSNTHRSPQSVNDLYTMTTCPDNPKALAYIMQIYSQEPENWLIYRVRITCSFVLMGNTKPCIYTLTTSPDKHNNPSHILCKFIQRNLRTALMDSRWNVPMYCCLKLSLAYIMQIMQIEKLSN